jgi:hypothetical protein
LAADDRLDTGFINYRVIRDTLKNSTEGDHFPGFETEQIDLVMKVPKHVGSETHKRNRLPGQDGRR